MSSVPQMAPPSKRRAPPSASRRPRRRPLAPRPRPPRQVGQAPLPERLVCRQVLGVARASFGYAVNLRFAYRGTQPEPYIVEGYVTGYDDGPLTGEAHARSCSCPDFEKRRGPARDQLRGEERCCKHMVLFLLLASLARAHALGRHPRHGLPARPPRPSRRSPRRRRRCWPRRAASPTTRKTQRPATAWAGSPPSSKGQAGG